MIPETQRSHSVSPGDTITINHKAGSSLTASWDSSLHLLSWYHEKPGSAPKLLIYHASTRATGVSDRFVGSRSGTDFTLTVRDFQADDIGEYHCMQAAINPRTVIQTLTKKPLLPSVGVALLGMTQMFPDQSCKDTKAASLQSSST